MDSYRPEQIERKWQQRWEREGVYQPDLDHAPRPFYNLMMYPYPSAEGLHVGNMYAFVGADIYGRYQRMQGLEVFQPIGLDGFGIHSENYALRIGEHPADVAERTEVNFYRQLRATGNAYAWENTLETYDPRYYRWTQWLFLEMYKQRLVERKEAPVNWCPSCHTVLSDEQVIQGHCERCGSEVNRRRLAQWFFNITAYAEPLLENLDWIDWSERVKTMQRNWIGRSEGAAIRFSVVSGEAEIRVFTTRIDTIFGVTFIALAPEHPLVEALTRTERREEVEAYVAAAKKRNERRRTELAKEKTGVFTGSYVVNPFNDETIPVFVTDFVAMGYGSGAIMGVPGHDQRDWEFARAYDLEIPEVVAGGNVQVEAYEGEGELRNSGPFSGLPSPQARQRMTAVAEAEGFGAAEVNYKLRDWCISRQRYWGVPIPMINCEVCGWVPVPEEDLPVELPHVEDYRPRGEAASPLAQMRDWVEVRCPQCGGSAERETDVSDTFLDSSWYFLRYPSVEFDDRPFDNGRTRKWLSVDMYVGGAEHAVLHLMYTRFITMALHDAGHLNFAEPFQRFYAHGLLTKDGAKMSKSKGNVVVPEEYIQRFGVDTLRLYLMFLGPFDQGGDFTDAGIRGPQRYLAQVYALALKAGEERAQESRAELRRTLHRTIKKVEQDIQDLKYNTAIATLMAFSGEWTEAGADALKISDVQRYLKLLAPFAPHVSEELWDVLGGPFSIHRQPWPEYDPGLVRRERITLVVQVNGRVRDTLEAQAGMSKEDAEERARRSETVRKWLEGKEVGRVVFVPDRLLNFVVTDSDGG